MSKWTPPEGFWERRGLPTPTPEFRFCERRWRFDFAWHDWYDEDKSKKVAVEVDGGVWIRGRHNRGKGFINDMEKMNEAQRLGWRVFRFTPQQMEDMKTVEFLREVLK